MVIRAGHGMSANDSYTVTADQLIKQQFTKSGTLVRAFLLPLAQNHPVDLVHGALVDLGKALSEYNSKEYHHIFPRAHLKKRESPRQNQFLMQLPFFSR